MKEIKINKIRESILFEKLDNGLEVYMWVNNKTQNYQASLNIKYGSIDTNFKIGNEKYSVTNGIAHFLEHIKFNEDENTTANTYFDKVGTGVNAYTTYDHTSYYIYGSNDVLGDVNHLLDFVQNRFFTSELIEKEKGIIIEEESMGNNNPSAKFYHAINSTIYNNDNRKYLITGTKSDIKAINKKEVELVFDTFYNPSNSYLIVCGNFNPEELIALIKENQKKKKFKEVKFKKIYEKEDASISVDKKDIKGNVTIPKMCFTYKMNKKVFKEISDLELRMYLGSILNATYGPTSELREELLEKNLIASLSYSYYVLDDIVIIQLFVTTKYTEEITKTITDSIEKLSITEDKFERRKKVNIAYLIASSDDIEEMTSFINSGIIYYNRVVNNLFDLYKSLDFEKAKKIIKQINLKNRCIITMKK